ncbi:NAD(P)H-hydrate dehydratase [Arsukibacterium indicum]|uniref:Bifunctional NAD(P)H-hydrate repair enzyme n=1 Tax=Arsukibacterium indicum TaxID=2848612 RepID=A0ABS6MM11_9GAMM|nr:NAD(P)H-hydrate dehydratase [Arsukibacterium indicum]MBV2129615.1 NAD(P)H-hydrate dehydratase [Arsukibacterium indicum]
MPANTTTAEIYPVDPSQKQPLFRADSIRQLEQRAITQLGSDGGFILMQRAAAALLELMQQRWPAPRNILVYAGAGNNGGDGYLLAALARAKGYDVRLCQHGDHSKLSNTAQQAAKAAETAGVSLVTQFAEAELLVDALFGIGLNRPLDTATYQLIRSINDSKLPVLAVDIPSGINADSGEAMPTAVKATATVSFIGLKAGLLMQDGLDHCGQLWLSLLQLASELNEVNPACRSISSSELNTLLPSRRANSHKGHFGHVLVIGGDHGFGGAAIMTAQTAVNCGAGKVSLYSRPEHISAMLSRQPEVMSRSHDCAQLLEAASVIAIGPGLGTKSWGQALMAQALATDKPLLMDADALNFLASLPAAQQQSLKRQNWVLTPHPGEAARLLNCSSKAIQRDRLAAVSQLQQRFGGVVLLKGAGTLICDQHGNTTLLAAAHPALASGGMGDVLSGVIAALLAQGLSGREACQLAAWLHLHAAAHLARQQPRPWLVATDLINQLKLQLIN